MKSHYNTKIQSAISNLILNCGTLSNDENVLIICDESTIEISNYLQKYIITLKNKCDMFIMNYIGFHGTEPPEKLTHLMYSCDLIICLTKHSLAHTQARFNSSKKGIKFLSLPDFSFKVLQRNAIQFDFRSLTSISFKIAEILSLGTQLTIHSKRGTNLSCNIIGREANPAPGWCYEKGVLASPPDSETNISLVEDGSNGILVVDGSIPCERIGRVKSDITLLIKSGKVNKISGNKSRILTKIFDSCENEKSRILAEFGIGLNPSARLCGMMLEDEGTLGTIHIGIGSNSTIGGKNEIGFHLDHVILNPSVWVDDFQIMNEGKLTIF
jgi:leucyl aminopeptidase (aminopeptidase T)